MNKIVQAVKKMVANSTGIVEHKHDEYQFFFTYEEKYLWSIEYNANEDAYILHFYPNIEEFMNFLENGQGQTLSSVTSICFSTKKLEDKEAYGAFKALFQLLQEKKYDFEKVLDEIIG